jgi:hypothetical protein
MPRTADRPITKVTMNFYTEDIEWLKDRFPDDYTVAIRDLVHSEVVYRKERIEE